MNDNHTERVSPVSSGARLVRLTDRRSVLRLGLVGLGTSIVAACGGGNGGTPYSTATTAPALSPSVLSTVTTGGSPTTVSGAASGKTLAAANAFIAMLSASQQSSAVVERTQPNLSQWSNLPDQLFKRSGLRMDKLTGDQQKAVLAILAAALSPEGYAQATQVTAADGVLAATGGANLDFGADHYWIRFVGTPSATTPWTIQYGGHHLAINVTTVGAKMTMAPTLWGSQPAFFDQAGQRFEPLSGETNKAFALMTLLDGTQQQSAILPSATREIMLGAGQDGKTLVASGVAASSFTSDQKKTLLALIEEWLLPMNAENAVARRAAAETELDATTFAWSGGSSTGSAIYYRVQSPSAVIEFAHQQGQGANAGGVDHIHSIYREIGNDYGVKLSA